MTDLAPLRSTLLKLRHQTLIGLASQLEEASIDAGLLALAAETQTTPQAIDDEGRPGE
jgi:hypothetical protein